MPRNALTSEELDSTRTRLCTAALTMFRASGVEAVTFRALADALGVSHTLPYRYFENKDALLASVRVLCFQRFEQYVREREPLRGTRPELGSDPAAEAAGDFALRRVMAVLDAYVSFVLDHPIEYELMFVMPQPPPQRYPDLLAARRSLFEHCVALVQDCIDLSAVRGESREVTHAVWAGLHGLLALHVANQLVHGYRLEELVQPMIRRLLGLEQSPSPTRDLSEATMSERS